jgi:beta-lactamase regulating signal transducer with metallopeptidase domain
MITLLDAIVSNVVLASGLALIAFGLTRVWRNPHVAHALWLLVLIKLVTPPFWHLSVPGFRKSPTAMAIRDMTGTEADAVRSADTERTASNVARHIATADSGLAGDADGTRRSDESPVEVSRHMLRVDSFVRVGSSFMLRQWRMVGLAVWSVGAAVMIVSLVRRHRRFRQVLAASSAVNAECHEETTKLGKALGLRRVPDTRATDAHIPPLVHAIGWTTVVLLPRLLIEEMDREQRQTILTHELAHLRRRDHWVRWFEVVVLCVYWWNPVAWWARRMLREATEECCDAWVVWVLPHARRSYGRALLRTIEFLTEREVVPAVAGTAFGGFPVKRRIEMIMKHELNRTLSWSSGVILLVAAALVLPVAAQTGTSETTIAGNSLRIAREVVAPAERDDVVPTEGRILPNPPTDASLPRVAQIAPDMAPGDAGSPYYALRVGILKIRLSRTQTEPETIEINHRFKLVLGLGVPGLVRVADGPAVPRDSKRDQLGIFLRATVLEEKANTVTTELALDDIGLIDGKADVHRLISFKTSGSLGETQECSPDSKAMPGLRTFNVLVERPERLHPPSPYYILPRSSGAASGDKGNSWPGAPNALKSSTDIFNAGAENEDRNARRRAIEQAEKRFRKIPPDRAPNQGTENLQEERLREIERKLERILNVLGESPRGDSPKMNPSTRN